MNPPLHWQVLDEGRAGLPALHGELVAAASLNQLALWRGGRPLGTATCPVRAPGRPVFTSDGVRWGPGLWRDGSGYQSDPALLALCDSGHRTPQFWAWDDDGARVLAGLASAPGGGFETWLAGPALRAPRRLASHGPAQAGWLGRDIAVIGHAQAAVVDLTGRPLMALDNPTPALRLQASADARRLLLVEPGRIGLYDLDTGARLARAEGRWIDASSTDGRTALAVDIAGGLWAIDLLSPQSAPRPLNAPGPVQGVATDGTRLVACLAEAPWLCLAAWPPAPGSGG